MELRKSRAASCEPGSQRRREVDRFVGLTACCQNMVRSFPLTSKSGSSRPAFCAATQLTPMSIKLSIFIGNLFLLLFVCSWRTIDGAMLADPDRTQTSRSWNYTRCTVAEL